MTYRYQHFTPGVVLEELRAIRRGLRPGDRLPAFELPTIDGGRFDTREAIGEQPMLIVFASFT